MVVIKKIAKAYWAFMTKNGEIRYEAYKRNPHAKWY